MIASFLIMSLGKYISCDPIGIFSHTFALTITLGGKVTQYAFLTIDLEPKSTDTNIYLKFNTMPVFFLFFFCIRGSVPVIWTCDVCNRSRYVLAVGRIAILDVVFFHHCHSGCTLVLCAFRESNDIVIPHPSWTDAMIWSLQVIQSVRDRMHHF